MKKMYSSEVLNDNMEFLVDYLKREIRCFGKMNGLSDSQISDMERDFIARLAFAAITGDDGKEAEKEPEKPEKPEQILQDICNTHRSCIGCMFARSDTSCRLAGKPYHWEVRT